MHVEIDATLKGFPMKSVCPMHLPPPPCSSVSGDDLILSSTNPLTTGRKSAMFLCPKGLLVPPLCTVQEVRFKSLLISLSVSHQLLP